MSAGAKPFDGDGASPIPHARFRADPKKVRVGIRRNGGRWLATAESRYSQEAAQFGSEDPRSAVMGALERLDCDGIDLEMQWAYDHPQWAGRP